MSSPIRKRNRQLFFAQSGQEATRFLFQQGAKQSRTPATSVEFIFAVGRSATITVVISHWAVLDLIGKGGHIRTAPIPAWVKVALDDWAAAAGITEGRIFRAVARAGKVWGDGISQNVVWYVAKNCCEKAGLQHIAPHDLRRTCAKLCHTSGGEIEQIQFLLGHASVQTTEHYLGCKQNLGHPVNDLFRLGNIDAATYVVLAGTAVLKVKPESAQPDKMSDDEGSGNQEGSDEGASAGFHGDGHPSV